MRSKNQTTGGLLAWLCKKKDMRRLNLMARYASKDEAQNDILPVKC